MQKLSATHKGVIHMTGLYHMNGMIDKLKKQFYYFFRWGNRASTQASVSGNSRCTGVLRNVRSDTVLYDIFPVRTGAKGQPKVHSDKLAQKEFEFFEV